MSLSKSPMDASQPLSAEEMILLRTLQDRALRSKAAEMHSNLPMSHDHDGLTMFGPSDEAGSEWSEVEGGSMADSSKRRLEPHVSSLTYAGPTLMNPMLSSNSGNMSSAVEKPPISYGVTKKGYAISLPPGVESLVMWGKTLIEFGKFASKGINYETLLMSTDKESMSYKKWCCSQADAAEGRLKDLALFLMACDYVTGQADQGPVIPGTKDVRRFKGD